MSSMDSTTAKESCDNCEKSGIPLKQCAKCKSASYCNRECQKAHWKVHKQLCSMLAGLRNPASDEQETSDGPTTRSDSKPFTAIHRGNFLHDRSEDETFKILIDVIRMRQEDTYTFEADNMLGTIYNRENSSAKAFRIFLRKAKQVDGLLPPWWTDEKAEECVRFGLDDARGSPLKYAAEKSDIQNEWKDDHMPMKLRMLGEGVYGNWPGVAPGGRGSMLTMMMRSERGSLGGAMSHLSLNPRRD